MEMANHPNRAKASDIAVVVTTSHRGVFFGYMPESDVNNDIIALRGARNCVSWSSDVRGFMGLASTGPNNNCRVGPAADISLRDITSVMKCSPAATEAWEKAPWTR
jgi:hypothetical protein